MYFQKHDFLEDAPETAILRLCAVSNTSSNIGIIQKMSFIHLLNGSVGIAVSQGPEVSQLVIFIFIGIIKSSPAPHPHDLSWS